MNSQDLINKTKPKMQAAYDHLLDELKHIRTGRASTALVEDVKVDVYGQEMALKAIAQITTPDGKSISITPWDNSNLAAIEKTIRDDQSLDLNPLNDGKTIHINVPPLTGERREQLSKQIGEKVEQTSISLRNARHETLNEAKRAKDNSDISEDDLRWVQKELDKLIEEYKKQCDSAAQDKRNEIMQV